MVGAGVVGVAAQNWADATGAATPPAINEPTTLAIKTRLATGFVLEMKIRSI
jgi:hypothetical protein